MFYVEAVQRADDLARRKHTGEIFVWKRIALSGAVFFSVSDYEAVTVEGRGAYPVYGTTRGEM